MFRWLKHYAWFIKESQSFMAGYSPGITFAQSLYKGIRYAKNMRMWDKMTPSQREAWYLTANRTMEI
jgi:hypothetical protein